MNTNRILNMIAGVGLAIAAGAGLSACNSTVTVVTDPYYGAWYDVYGNYCFTGYAAPGCDFYANGAKIVDSSDPYYGPSNVLYYDTWSYTDVYGYWASYTGYAWLSSTGILYDANGTALNEQDANSESRDIVGEVAQKEAETIASVSQDFSSRYALSEEKATQVVQTLQDWAKLGKDRRASGRTDKDIADFSNRLYGVSVERATSALASAAAGDSSKIDSVNVDIARFWGTSPETSKEILKGFYKREAALLNL